MSLCSPVQVGDTSLDDEAGSAQISQKFNSMKSTFANVFKKQGGLNPPKPPSKDFLETGKSNGAAVKDSPSKGGVSRDAG